LELAGIHLGLAAYAAIRRPEITALSGQRFWAINAGDLILKSTANGEVHWQCNRQSW
jgi:hypothetical protein